MEYRQLGRTGLRTSVLGMGCSRLGSFLATSDPAEARATVEAAVAGGVSFFDTADIYGQGDSERILGEAVRPHRDAVLITTKAGRRFSGQARLAARLKAPLKRLLTLMPGLKEKVRGARGGQLALDFSPDHVAHALEASLGRLGTDRVDLFLLHGPPAALLVDGPLFERLRGLKQAGKARAIGVSVGAAEEALAAAGIPGVEAIQLPVGPRHRAALAPVLPELARRGIAVVGREVFEGVAHGATANGSPARAALRDAASLPGVSVILAGMSRRAHLADNLAAFS